MKKFFYRVTEGDTVLSVSKRFSVSLVSLIEKNSLSGEIEAGDILYIEEESVYFVLPEDDLAGLSVKFNIEADEILTKNRVDYLFYGLNLLI